jgi:hypothetical protein
MEDGLREGNMSDRVAKLAESVRQTTPLVCWAEAGVSPDEVKNTLIQVLLPHFTNEDVLRSYGVEAIAPEAIRILKLQYDDWAYQAFRQCLSIYQSAAKANLAASVDACAQFYEDVVRGMADYWSIWALELDKSNLALEDFRYEAFRNIGSLIESSIQPFLRDLLMQVRIVRGQSVSVDAIRSLSLGNIANELHGASGVPEVVAPSPWKLRLNQWRNIAQHHSSTTRGDLIVASYREGASPREITLSRGELLSVALRVHKILAVLGGAHSIFVLDHDEQIRPLVPKIPLRNEHLLFWLSTAVATQGFELAKAEVTDNSLNIVVRDLTKGDLQSRALHASQFVHPAWEYFHRDEVTVTSLAQDETPVLETTAKGVDCAAVSSGAIEFSVLADRVRYKPLRGWPGRR